MRIAYFLDDERFRWMADMSAASARAHMPGVAIHHITTDTAFPAMHAADMVHRRCTPPGNFMDRWSWFRDELEGDVLYADADTLFRADVRSVFEFSFDLAVPHIKDPHVRYDGGVVFSRIPGFWKKLRETPAYSCGHDQTPVPEIVATFNRVVEDGPWDVARLAGSRYSYVPRDRNDPCTGAAIIHFRGPRKDWMRGHYGNG